MALHEQYIDCLQVVDISVLLELFSHLGSDLRNGHIQGVHLLDLGTLSLLSALPVLTA